MTARIFTRPINRTKLYEEIEKVLLASIIRGELTPGEKLSTERELARKLEVNRSTIREALSKLESLDLVEIRHGDGAYIKNYLESGNLELIREMIHLDKYNREGIIKALLEFRTITAPQMARRAAQNRTEEHIHQLEDIIYSGAGLPIVEKDIRVHHIVALACNNILYLVLLNFFNKFMYEYGFLYFEDEENQKRSLKFHEDIYKAIKEKDPEKAFAVMHDVMDYSEHAVIRTLLERDS